MTLHDELRETAIALSELEVRRARLLARLMSEELRGGDVSRVSQTLSPLGSRNHIAAVKRRIAEEREAGEPPGTRGAFVAKRQFLLTQEALAEELGRGTHGAAARLAKVARKTLPANAEQSEDGYYEQALAQMRGAR